MTVVVIVFFMCFQFFLKATQLEQMKNDYIDANQSKEVALEILRQKKEVKMRHTVVTVTLSNQ